MLLVLLVDVAICAVTDAVVCGEASDVNGEEESEGAVVSVAMTAVAVVGAAGGAVVGAVTFFVSAVSAELATEICRRLHPKIAGWKELWSGVSDQVILSWRTGILKSI